MRADIAKVITERERAGSTNKLRKKGYKKRLQKEGLDVDKRESIKALKGDTKNFTDVLQPLRGFLVKNCGRPWDKVFSEICAVLPAGAGVSLSHARDHLLNDFMEFNTQKIGRDICDSLGRPLGSYYRHGRFYVDDYGILRKIPRKKYKYQPPAKLVFAKTDKGEWLVFDKQHTQLWFACEMVEYKSTGKKPHPEAEKNSFYRSFPRDVYPIVYDVFLKQTVYAPWPLHQAYGQSVYCIRKRQLGKREIRKHKLLQPAA